MRASELILRLEEIIRAHGDIEIELPDGRLMSYVTVLGDRHELPEVEPMPKPKRIAPVVRRTSKPKPGHPWLRRE